MCLKCPKSLNLIFCDLQNPFSFLTELPFDFHPSRSPRTIFHIVKYCYHYFLRCIDFSSSRSHAAILGFGRVCNEKMDVFSFTQGSGKSEMSTANQCLTLWQSAVLLISKTTNITRRRSTCNCFIASYVSCLRSMKG